MRILLPAILLVGLVWTTPVAAQSADSGLEGKSPFENNASGAVRLRAPGTWVNAARVRHQELNAQRARGIAAESIPDDGSGTTTGDGTGGVSDLGGLLDLMGGATGSGDSLTGLLDSFTGGGTSGGGSATTGGSGTSLADLLALRDALQGTSKELSTAQTIETRDASGAIGRLPKPGAVAQSSGGDERKFVVRWADRMAQTIFTSLALGMQSQDFIDFLADGLRDIFMPTAQDDGGDGGSGDGGDGGGDGGDGIEDVDPPDGSDGGDGSIV